MSFAPRPENDFAQYIQTYYRECRFRFERIEAIAGKWMFRDLIPGMSDFDARFICADGMTADDWCRMSSAIGEAHLALCRRYPCWARNLEHLPGVNLTWSELVNERTYYPEYPQWSFYDSTRPDQVCRSQAHFAARPWDAKDEYFHLRRFCTYYGRYNRTIDPPINMGVHEPKYPLHSRLMHYFTPPVQSAVSILRRRPMAGKFDTLELAAEMFPELAGWCTVMDILAGDYRTPQWYEEPHLTRLEDQLEEVLQTIARALRPALTLLPDDVGREVAAWKQALRAVPVAPALVVFDNARFSRLMKGRLWFYANAPEGFDVIWLIRNELGRIGNGFFRVPFRTYWKVKTGRDVQNPVDILPDLTGDVLSQAEADAVRQFDRLTTEPFEQGGERRLALAIADVFDGFYHALGRISEDLWRSA
jgi:hypothetical protein